MNPPTAAQALTALRNIAAGVRMYGAPSPALLAQRIESRVTELESLAATQAPAVTPAEAVAWGETAKKLKAKLMRQISGKPEKDAITFNLTKDDARAIIEALKAPPGAEQQAGERPYDFDAVERAMDLASMLAGSVALNEVEQSAMYRNALRAHLRAAYPTPTEAAKVPDTTLERAWDAVLAGKKGDSPQAEPVAIVSNIVGGGPRDVCIEWRGGITSIGAKLYAAPLPQPSPDSEVERFFVETPDAGVFGFDTLKDAKDCQRDMSGTVYTAKPSDAGSAEAQEKT